jgi:O-antigen ligase
VSVATGSHARSPSAATDFVAPLAIGALVALGLVLAARGAYVALLAPFALLLGAFLLLRRPDAAVAIVAFAIYANAPAVAVQVHGVPFLIAAATPLLLFLPIGRDLLLRGEPPVVTSALPFIVAFFAVQLVGVLFALRPEEAMDGLWNFTLEGMLLYLLFTNAIRTPAALRQVLWSVVAAGAFMGAVVTYQQLSGSFDEEFFGFGQLDVKGKGFVVEPDGGRQKRLGGPLGMPNRFAQIMAILVPVALFLVQASRARGAKLLAAGALLLIMTGCALGFSRGAAVGLALTFLVMAAMGHVNIRHLLAAAAAVGCVVLVVPQYAIRLASLGRIVDLVSDRGGPGLQNADSSTRGRLTEMAAGALIFADHPVVGVGPEMYRRHYPEYARIAGGRVRGGPREAHNLPLQIGAEHGLLGLAALGGVFLLTIRDLLRARRRWWARRPDLALLATGLLLALVAYLATSLFLHASYIRYLWLLLGLAGAAGCITAPEERTLAVELRPSPRPVRGSP